MGSTKKRIITKNKTYKIKKTKNNLTEEEKKIICKKYQNTYTTFEDKLDIIFKKKHIKRTSKEYNLEKEILNDLKQAVSPSKITPQNDFYSYINERWLKNYQREKGQEYIIQYDDFRIVQDKVYHQLIDIVKDYITTHNSPFSKCMRNFYESKRISEDKLKEYSAQTLKQIDELRKNKNNLWKMLGLSNEYEIISWGSPFVWMLNPDDKNPDTYRCYIEGPQLTLIDLNIYYNENETSEYKKNYKKEYFKYLTKLFENSFGKNNDFKPEHVFNCEVKIFNAFDCYVIKKESPDGYNLVKTKDAQDKYNFNWKEFSHSLGFDYTPDFFITSNLNYLFCMTEILLKEWDNEEWRSYWIYIFIRQQQRYTREYYKPFYQFQGVFSRGQEGEVGDEIFPVYTLAYAFNTFLTKEYEKKFRNEQLVNYVKMMAEDLKTVFIKIIKRNKWLQPSTKKMAIKKLENFNITLSSPNMLRRDPILDYSNTDLWANLLKISEWRHKEAVNLEGKNKIDIPIIDWSDIPPKLIGTQAYVVNAAYTPSENGIYIPLGYIQKPFVDLEERGIEYNLAHIGFTLAHEMSHALDDWGSKYDETGKLNNWWTKKDQKKFEEIQKNVIKQYEVFASYDGVKFDAEPSIGEDLADISGLAICREYLRDFQMKNEDILPIQKISFEAFFIYFAFQQRQKLSKKALQAQLKTNPHPPDKYRCNVPLSRLPVFRTIFNVKKGDKMWWSSTNRVWDD